MTEKQQFTGDSWIKLVVYDPDTREMIIHLEDKSYACEEVPQDIFDAFRNSASRGKFFNENIRGKYLHLWFQ